MIHFIKTLIKKVIPFYMSYTKSRKSTIHNQTFFEYVIFRLTGRCNRGGVFPCSLYLYNSQYAKNICGY